MMITTMCDAMLVLQHFTAQKWFIIVSIWLEKPLTYLAIVRRRNKAGLYYCDNCFLCSLVIMNVELWSLEYRRIQSKNTSWKKGLADTFCIESFTCSHTKINKWETPVLPRGFTWQTPFKSHLKTFLFPEAFYQRFLATICSYFLKQCLLVFVVYIYS